MLAFSNDYYGFIFRATQSVELFCAYDKYTLHDVDDIVNRLHGIVIKNARRISPADGSTVSSQRFLLNFIC